ncbi:MAG: hypothetical protein AB7T15_05250 [Desulfuromonas sp.]|jgi:hypothetical protein|nr:hypothetical protein [Desulfuromonas thiophila]MDY0397472.1 hypothetical protein [Desulfuromonas thiophila]
MTISGNPKKLAQDIADGYFSLSPPLLRPYTAVDLKTLASQLNLVQRDLRQEQIPLDDVLALKARNNKLQRVNQALNLLRGYCQKRRIAL